MLYVYIYVVYFVMYDSVLILLLSYGHHGWFNKVFLFYSLWFYQNILWNRYHRNVRIILTDNIFFWWRFFFQQIFGIHIGINCAPRRIRPLFVLGWLHTWLLMVKKNKKMLSPPLRQKRWFQFSHWEFSIHPAQSTYGVYISQLIWYSIACGSYHEFIERGCSHQGRCWTKGSWCLCWSHHFETFKVHDLINRYGCHKWPRICCCNHNVFLSPFMTYHSVCNTTCANNGTWTVYPFGLPEFNLVFLWGSRLLSRY